MDIGNMLNMKGGAAGMQGLHPDAHQFHLQSHANRSMSENISDRGTSPHGSEQSRYSSAPSMNQVNLMSMNGNMRYSSPTTMQTPLPILQGYRHDSGYETSVMAQNNTQVAQRESPADTSAQKAFPCSTCGKGFARRSDLARHERIHSGVRPHVCDYPNCGKQFIQRSALTVHARVHTGEKPHMCERCGKPFSDSSSLARHRRIHSGKRPYKCPYADCQKTFTRRTTLTRHQNHHTGTVEEAAAATAAALAGRNGLNRTGRQGQSDTGDFSQSGSPMSTPSPAQRDSLSPGSELAPLSSMPRNDYQYMNNSALPVHLRENHYMSQTSHPQVPTMASNYSAPMQQQQQQRPTSHPNPYVPPQILEPPAQPPSTGSANGSPHMSSVGWNTPTHMASPTIHVTGYAAYADQDPYGQAQVMGHMGQHMYFPNGNIRRPQSTEPDHYDMKPRMQHEMWATAS